MAEKTNLLPLEDLKDQIQSTGIKVPIYRAEANPDGSITFYLYGGHPPVTWSPTLGHAGDVDEASQSPKPEPLSEGLTMVTGVGRKTSQKLRDHGIVNLVLLAKDYNAGLLSDYIPAHTLVKIAAWLEENSYL